jgi:hypothetical protein
MEDFYRIRRLPPYVFEEVNKAKANARNAGADIIDLGMGNPDLPAPTHVIEKLKGRTGQATHRPLLVFTRHSRIAPRAGCLLRPSLWRKA